MTIVERATIIMLMSMLRVVVLIVVEVMLLYECFHFPMIMLKFCCESDDDHVRDNNHLRYEILGQCTWGQGPKEA